MAKKYVYTEAQNGWRGYFGFEQTIDFVNKKVIINWESGLHLADGTTGFQTSPVTIKGLKFFIKTPAGNGIEPHDENGLNQYTHNVSSEETESEIYYSPFNVEEGSFSIKYDSFYQASFKISFKVDIKNGNNWVECRNKKEGLYDSFILEPGCTEPTSPTFFKVTPKVALGKYIPGAGTTFTFEIRGAKNGVNNNIKEYRVFSQFSYGSAGGISGFTTVIKLNGESNDIKKEVTLSRPFSDLRGSTLRFSVSSVGELSNISSSPYYSSDSFYINRLPDIPAGKNLTILSNETEGHIKVTPGADLDNHSCTVYYSKENETYQQYLSTTKLKPGAYNFKTYDGLEYSNAALGLSVTKNQKPVVSSFGVEMVQQGTSSRLKDADNNAFVYAAKLRIKDIIIEGNWTSLSLGLVPTLTGDDKVINVQKFSSIRQLENFIIAPLNYLNADNDKLTQYKIIIAASNIEDGDPCTVESIELEGVDKKFCLSPIPKGKGYINNNNSNKHYGNEGYFCAETGLTFMYTPDSEYQLDIACNKPFEYGYLAESDAENKNFKVTIISSLSEGTEYQFTPTIYSGINREKGDPIALTAIKYPRVTTAKVDDNIILYPFTDTDGEKFTIRMNDFFQNENEKYGFSAVGENALKEQIIAIFNLGGERFELSSSEIAKEGEIITLSFLPDRIYNALKGVVQAGRYQVSASLRLTNCFGEQDFVGVSPSFMVSYDSPPSIEFTKEHILGSYGTEGQITLYRYKDSPPTESPNIEKPFIEGETLSFTPSISGYTKKIKYIIQISRGDTQIWEDYLRGESSLSEEDPPSRNKPKNYNINVKKVIGEIFDNRKCFFRIIIYYGDNNKMGSPMIGPFSRFRLAQPTFELLSTAVDNKNLAISYHLNDIGLDNIENEDYPLITSDSSLSLLLEELQNQPATSAVTLIGSEDAVNKWKNFINNEFIISTEIEDSPNYETRLCTITCAIALRVGVDNGTTYSIKKETSKTIRYYILQPTVAFRKNRIGINTTLIDNKTDAVMIVRAPSSEVRYIYFLSDDTIPKSSEKSIVSWSGIPCIDLKDKTIKNFLVDGGTWS